MTDLAPIPMLDLRAQWHAVGEAVERSVLDVLRSGRYILGPKNEELERRMAGLCGVEHAVAISSGTDALLAAFMALGIVAGDVVVTTPYSFFATAGTIVRLGATPAFVDINPDTFNMDPNALARWFEQSPLAARARAIVPVHLFGECADMAPIFDLAVAKGVPVIEDAAQAIGATYLLNGTARPAGGMGLCGCFSFYPTKNLGAAGEGGMIVTGDSDFAERARCMRNHGALERYYHDVIGGNFRLDEIQCAVLLAKFDYLAEWNERRRANAAYYDEHLRVPEIKTPRPAYDRAHHVYHQYVIQVLERRDDLRAHLAARGIASDIYYPVPFHLQKCFAYLGHREGDFPHSEHAARHSLALPIYPELTRPQQDRIIEAVISFYR